MEIVLASKSARRKRVLEALGLKFTVDASDADERSINEETPEATVRRIAELKAETVAKRHKGALIIAADTMVVFGDEIIGQANDEEHAREMMRKLTGTTHDVITGLCLINTSDNKKIIGAEISKVTLSKLSDSEINEYIKMGLHEGKAGAYNIDDPEFMCFVEKIEGSASNIIGLPVEKLADMLKNFGVIANPEGWNEQWNAGKMKI